MWSTTGDLHSPLTFILCTAPLIEQLINNGNPIFANGTINERHADAAFADDLSLITSLDLNNFRDIKTTMLNFGDLTGLRLNETKTVVMPLVGSPRPDWEHQIGFCFKKI